MLTPRMVKVPHMPDKPRHLEKGLTNMDKEKAVREMTAAM